MKFITHKSIGIAFFLTIIAGILLFGSVSLAMAAGHDDDFESEVGVGSTFNSFNARQTSVSTANSNSSSNTNNSALEFALKAIQAGGGLPSAAGGVRVNNAICSRPGPGKCTGQNDKPGTNGVPCGVSGLLGGSIRNPICNGNVCALVGVSTCATPTFTTFAESLKQSVANTVIQSLVQNVMSKLMGGGAGGGGGGGSSNFNPNTTSKAPDLLSIDPSLTPDDSTGGFLNLSNLLFGAGDTTETVNNDTADTSTGIEVTSTTETTVQAGDTVETTYEQVGGSDEDGSEGDGFNTSTDTLGTPGTPKDFTEDLFDSSFLDFGEDSSSSGSLTRADLERQGLLEAARFGINQKEPQGSLAISYESLTPAEIRSLQDYQSSRVAVSGNLNPFQGQKQNNADQTEQEQQDGFFKKLGRFFSTLFGFGPPAQ